RAGVRHVHLVIDVFPGIARGFACILPGHAGLTAIVIPARAQVAFDVRPFLVLVVAAARLPAVAVGGLNGAVGRALSHIRARRVVLAPVFVLRRRVHCFGDALACQATGDGTSGATDRESDRPTHGRADCRTCGRTACRAGTRAHGVRAGRSAERITILVDVSLGVVLLLLRHVCH